MFKENKKLFYVLGTVLVVIIALQYFLPHPTDLGRNFLNKSKSPFGCYAIYRLMQDAYSEKASVNSQTLYNLNEKKERNRSFISVDRSLDLNSNDINALYDFLKRGNTVLLAANYFKGALCDSLHLQTSGGYFDFSEPFDSLLKNKGFDLHFFSNGSFDKTYSYPKLANSTYFSRFDTSNFKVTAVYEKNKACMIKTKVGAGTLYLLSTPDIFGNYFISGHKNRQAVYTCLSMIKNEEIIWDEYYKSFRIKNNSPLKLILESDALYSAYLLLIFSIITYMIFEGRRRQRVIPIVEPLPNTTLEFVNVISQVYYNSKNHKSIAVEKIKYFYEALRRKFNVDTNTINEEFFSALHDLSGIDLKQIKQLFSYCERIKTSGEITEYDLLELNRQIENFNKNSLR